VHAYKLNAAAFAGYEFFEEELAPPWIESSFVRGVAANIDSTRPVSTDVKGLVSGASYCFEVRAIGSQGPSQPSVCSNILHLPPGVPSVCRGFIVRQVGLVKFALSWQPPAESGGLDIDRYLILATPASCSDDAPLGSCETREEIVDAHGLNPHWIRHTLADLSSNTQYTFSIAALNSAGKGAEVNPCLVQLLPANMTSKRNIDENGPVANAE